MKTTNINSKPTPVGDKSEELARIKAASARLVDRARQDPKVARAFLRDIGYYRIMGITDPDNSPKIKPGARKTTVRKTTSANGKITGFADLNNTPKIKAVSRTAKARKADAADGQITHAKKPVSAKR